MNPEYIYQHTIQPNTTKTLVLIHGYACDHRIWNPLLPLLSPHLSIISFDLPGYYTQESLDSSYSLQDISGHIFQLLDDLKIDKAAILGHSMGGYIALELLKNYPEKVESLTLLNSHCYFDSPAKIAQRKRTIQFIEKNGTEIYLQEVFKSLFQPNFYTQNKFEIDILQSHAQHYPVSALIHSNEAMIGRREHIDTLQKAQIPLHFLLGERDDLIPDISITEMPFLNPQYSNHIILPMCGHMGMLESTQLVGNYLIQNL